MSLPHWQLYLNKLRLKSKILANKKYLINDPIVQGMNDTQWLFEFEAYAQSKEARYEEYKVIMDAWRNMLISLLGLNLLPIEEEEGGRLRMPTQDEIMPLSLIMGREEVVSTISKKLEEFRMQSDVDVSMEAGEVASIDEIEEAFPDMVFADDPNALKNFKFFHDPDIRKVHEAWVLPLDKKDEPVVRRPKRSRLKIE